MSRSTYSTARLALVTGLLHSPIQVGSSVISSPAYVSSPMLDGQLAGRPQNPRPTTCDEGTQR